MLTHNQTELECQGLCYFRPVNAGEFSLHHQLALGSLNRALARNSIDYAVHEFHTTDDFRDMRQYFRDLDLHMSSNSLSTAVVSSEGFFGPCQVFCNALLRDAPGNLMTSICDEVNLDVIRELREVSTLFDVQIVVYLRRQDSHFNSLYNHYLRENLDRAFRSPKQLLDSNPHVYDYHKELLNWSRFFGKENVTPFIFERSALPQGLVEHFIENVLGRNVAQFKIDPTNLNERQPKVLLDFVTLLLKNVAANASVKEEILDFFEQNRRIPFSSYEAPFLSPQESSSFLDSVASSNRLLGRDFFGLDTSPFPNPESAKRDIQAELEDTRMLASRLLLLSIERRRGERERVLEYEGKLQSLTRELAVKEETGANELKRLVQSYEQSTSWKLTAPLRWFARRVRLK
jgi:hypothetical protein